MHLASLYKEAYRDAKQVSPHTKVFVSFQWEWMRILDAKEPHKIREHTKVVDIFRPQLDVIGLTTYPSSFYGTPTELPQDYYAWIYHHIHKTDELLLMEVGCPTEGSGSEVEQQAFIGRLPDLLKQVKPSVIAWALLHDVEIAEFDANLQTVGILTKDGRKKLGYEAFGALKNSTD